MAQEKWDEVKDKAKDIFMMGVDFVFYNKEVKGVTWDELKDEAKQLTLDNLGIIDEWIMEVLPNYKENISEKYTDFKDFMSGKYYDMVEYIKNKMSDDTLNKINDTRKSVKDTTDKVWDKVEDGVNNGKTRVKVWYENFRNRN